MNDSDAGSMARGGMESPEANALVYWLAKIPVQDWVEIDVDLLSHSRKSVLTKLVLLELVEQRIAARLSKQGSDIEGRIVFDKCGYVDIMGSFMRLDILPEFPEWRGADDIKIQTESIVQVRLSGEGERLAFMNAYLCQEVISCSETADQFWDEIADLILELYNSPKDIARRVDETYAQLRAIERIGAPLDGPYGLNQWSLGGGVINETLQGAAWNMINFLWELPDRTATFEELVEPTYGDQNHLADGNAFGSLRRAANKYFQSHGIPLKVRIAKGTVALEDAERNK